MPPKKGKFAKPTKPPQIHNTHFVCLPLTTEDSILQLNESLAKFRDVTSLSGDAAAAGSAGQAGQNLSSSSSTPPGLCRIPHAAYRPPGTFHLTLGVMDLSSHEDMEKALKLLNDIDYSSLLRKAETKMTTGNPRNPEREPTGCLLQQSEMDHVAQSGSGAASAVSEGLSKPLESLERAISPPPPASRPKTTSSLQPLHPEPEPEPKPQPLMLTLHGLGTFPSASSARVFFAHAHDASRRLQPFAELVRQRFQAAGLITETRPLVLHATMANMTYVKRPRRRDQQSISSSGPGSGSGAKTASGVDGRDILAFFNRRSGSDGEDVDVGTESLAPPGTSASKDVDADAVPEGYIWASDITVDKVRICKMGAEPCDLPGWGLEYRPIAESVIV
ncbi:hypothetical protein LTR84_011190 [Exophiala bonariae]|uniref:A-kinase anchor protein 7-like phosphoesterase domain-containing protein n=1 Tax=Exophiala bonariae TaxID=1690606 RepID=A0AAV9NIU3_9EURO|nr:hypothetical protein LTR84_011190 [Exophiala bonariae]